MQHRNRLAKAWWAMQNPELDDNTVRLKLGAVGAFKEEERICGNCNANLACSFYARMSGDLPEGSVRADIASNVLGHLSEKQLSYAWHWLLLLDVECVEAARQHPQAFWKYSVERRVNAGTCAAFLRVSNTPAEARDINRPSNDDRCEPQTKRRIEEEEPTLDSFVRLDGPLGSVINIAPGSYIALSEQNATSRRAANRLGFVQAVVGNSIYLDFDLDPKDKKTSLDPTKEYVVDLVNSSSSFAAAYANLIRLLEPDQSRLRETVIGEAEPTFEPLYPRADIERCMDILTDLNETQIRAVIRLLTARDHLLLQGMPGTGKTTVIVAAVRVLVRLGQRVLVTSNTHNALDNILEKLEAHKVDFVRMGKTLHPIVRSKTNLVRLAGATSVDEVRRFAFL
ncbi:DNA2 helicase-like, partial [Tropilaelaps mercedesae]